MSAVEALPRWPVVPLWGRPLVDPNPRRVPRIHREVLERQIHLPSPEQELPRRPDTLTPFTAERYDKGLWEMARHYRDCYIRPADLDRDCQDILRRIRAASQAVLDAPGGAWKRLIEVRENKIESGLDSRIWRMARTLSTVRHDDDIDVGSAYWNFLSTLERCAAQAFDYAFEDAKVIEVLAIRTFTTAHAQPPAVMKTPPGKDWPMITHQLACDCGRTTDWLLVIADGHPAVGCKCGRMWWWRSLPLDQLKAQFPEHTGHNFRDGFDLNSLAAELGFGPFQHSW
ncbi:hypothetical protein ACFRKE_11290 [Kitasatospora indigofera]|uniref:hypothetical protein n=1 Tax=Kitasatospora indigofera TaxID=67307 RepID=UPI003689A311